MRARFVVRQFANSLDAHFYSPTPGLEVTRVLLAMALSKDLTILFGDISVAFMNTPMPEGDPVYVEPPERLHEHSGTVWCLKRALNGLRYYSRLFHEHFADVLTSRIGFTRSEAHPTLFVDLARTVYIAVHVDDLIMVGSSSQLHEVVDEMKQNFTVEVTPPLSASSTQTDVGARYLPRGDAIWELPTTRYVTGMLNEHGMKDAKPVVSPAVNRNDDDDDEEEASAEGHRILRRIVDKSQFLAPRWPDIAFSTNRLARSLGKPSRSDIIASKRLLRYLRGTFDFGLKLQVQNRACSTLTVFTDGDWAGDRPTRKSVSSWVIMLDGVLLSAGARTQSVITESSCEAEYIAATAPTSEAKYIQALFLAYGQHVNIHLRSDSSGAIGVASKRGLQRLRHLDLRFLWLQPETSKVPRPENVADANTKPADRRSLELCRMKMGVTETPKQFRDAVLCQVRRSFFLSLCHRSCFTSAATAVKF